DGAGNLRCDLPATAGREGQSVLCIQGHLDMVCAAAPGSGYDPQRDGITCVVEGGFLRSDGRSSLGADDLLGVASALWLLEQGTAHGPLRLLLTVQEETGLQGAAQVPPDWLDGVAALVNVDGFSAHRCVVAAAGGVRQRWTRPIATVDCPLPAWRVTLSGYPGGHSGSDIGRGRENPLRLLAALAAQSGGELASLSGGQALNAIPTGGELVVCLADPARLERLLAASVPAERYTLEPMDKPTRVCAPWDGQAVLDFLLSLLLGVLGWRQDAPTVPAASTNLGVIDWRGDGVTVGLFHRAGHAVVLERTANGAALHAERCGFVKEAENAYAPWEGTTDSPLARRVADCYRAVTGREMEVTAVHVGLEPAALLAHHPGLPAVSIGPTILDPHSVSERAALEELPDFVRVLGMVMERGRL
ncbi:MAG: M20/M25/M40 family metallo-hydrolase, partial [Clostridiales bacterium]|nr:M20/M25/M40 family metallo-hydrolase [Clostridiales bacterium]